MSRIDESQLEDVNEYREPDIQDTIKALHERYGGELEEGQKFLRVVQLEFKLNGRKFLLKPDIVEGMKDLGLRMVCDLYVTLHVQAAYLTWLDRLKATFNPGKGIVVTSQSGDSFLMTGVHARPLAGDVLFMNQLKSLLLRGSSFRTRDNTLSLLSPGYREGDIEKFEQLAVRLESLVKKA